VAAANRQFPSERIIVPLSSEYGTYKTVSEYGTYKTSSGYGTYKTSSGYGTYNTVTARIWPSRSYVACSLHSGRGLLCSGSEAGSHSRRIDFCITQL